MAIQAIVCFAAPTNAADETPAAEDIDRAVRDLGADSFKQRERASNLLWRAGAQAEAQLKVAAESPDAEVANRADALLKKLRWGIRPDTSKAILELIGQYRTSQDSRTRLQIVEKLMRQGTPALPAVLSIAATATDDDLRRTIVSRQYYLLPRVIESGQLDLAERFIELSASSEEIHEVARTITLGTAFAYLRGNLEPQIRKLEKQYKAKPSDSLALRLIYFLRAADRLERASKIADQLDGANSTSLSRHIRYLLLYERGQWKRAALAFDRILTALPEQQFGDGRTVFPHSEVVRQSILHGLADNEEQFKKSMNRLLQHIADENRRIKGFAWAYVQYAARAMAIAGDLDDAIRLLKDHGESYRVFEILAGQGRYVEAFDFARKISRGNKQREFNFDIEISRAIVKLGEQDKARKLLTPYVAPLLTRPDLDRNAALASACLAIGMLPQAQQLAVAALEAKGADAASTVLGGWYGDRTVGGHFSGHRPVEACAWWRSVRELYPKEAYSDSLDRVMALMDGKYEAKDRKAIVSAALREGVVTGRRLSYIGEACRKAKWKEEARLVYEHLARDYYEVVARSRLAELYLEDGRPNEALKLFEPSSDAWRASSRPMLFFWEGQILNRAGFKEKGKQRIRTAELMFVDPKYRDHYRFEFSEALREQGFREFSNRQHETLRRTAPLGSWQRNRIMRFLAKSAYERGDLKRALNYYGQYLASGVSDWGSIAQTYVQQPHFFRLLRVQVHLAERRIEQAVREAEICQRYLPGDVKTIEVVYPSLVEHGRTKKARELFDRAYSFNQQICADFPRSAVHHARLARLAGACRLKLDEGMIHGRRAIELAPNSAESHAALATVHFARNEKEEALHRIRRSIELAPDEVRYGKLQKRFLRTASPTDE